MDLLRCMKIQKDKATVSFDSLRNEPYFTSRAVYFNDSALQMSICDTSLIHDVHSFRWSSAKWEQLIDQLAFFRYNALQMWITPNMF